MWLYQGEGEAEFPVKVHLSFKAIFFSPGSVLNEEKAMQSLAAWQYLTTVPCAHPGSYLAAAESVLCYHLSHLPGELMIFIFILF